MSHLKWYNYLKYKKGESLRKVLKLSVVAFVGVFVLSGCSQKRELPVVDNLTNKEVKIKSAIPFSQDSFIKESIKDECSIEKDLSDFIKKASNNNSVNVVQDDNATKDNSEYYLDVKIVDAISEGNAFIGHKKQTKISGVLYKKGNAIASFKGLRNSSGGFGAGFKGSCTVLERTIESLGKDVSEWIKEPTNGAMLGE